MIVDLDTDELFYLLDNCMRGSHLRSGTIERFVDEWYQKLGELQRMALFEWAVRLCYAWYTGNDERCFRPSASCCGKDIIFMKRFHPENQYEVDILYNGKSKTERAFLMDGKYHVGCTRFIDPEYIIEVRHLDLSKWKEYKQPGVDYDKNILT